MYLPKYFAFDLSHTSFFFVYKVTNDTRNKFKIHCVLASVKVDCENNSFLLLSTHLWNSLVRGFTKPTELAFLFIPHSEFLIWRGFHPIAGTSSKTWVSCPVTKKKKFYTAMIIQDLYPTLQQTPENFLSISKNIIVILRKLTNVAFI